MKMSKSASINVIIPGFVFLLASFYLFSPFKVMATTNQNELENLLYMSSPAFSDISRMVETDCYNDIDDDGDGLIDMDDAEDCISVGNSENPAQDQGR